MKYVTFSFDDCNTQDIRLVELFNKYGAKATFNINTGLFGVKMELPPPQENVSHEWLSEGVVFGGLYNGHELASHTLTHPTLWQESDDEILRQIKTDAENIEKHLGFPTVGMAYPNGGYAKEHYVKIADICRKNTTIKYARTTMTTYAFDFPQNYYEWDPTMHWCDPNFDAVCQRFIDDKSEGDLLLYVWGHSYEMDCSNGMETLEKWLKIFASQENVKFVTNAEAMKN